MAPSEEAKRLENVETGRAKPKEEVLTEASTFVSTHGGDPSDQFLVLAHCKLQFGKYQGQRFRWLLENSLGYAVYLVLSISKETAQTTPLSENKQLFLQYTSHIREMAEEVEKYERKQEMQAEARATGDQGCLMVEFGDFQGRSMRDVYEDQSKEAQALIRYLVKADARPNTNMALFKTYVLKRQGSAVGASVRQPARPPATASASAPPPAAIRAGVQQTATVKALLARGKHLSPSQLAKKIMSPVKPYPLLQSTAAEPPAKHLAQRQLFTTGTSIPATEGEDDDEELVFAASQCEAQLNTETCAGPSPSAETAKTPDLPHHQPPSKLPSHWKDHLPPFQHEWIRNTLFKANPRTGKPELVSQLKLWWYPPQPPLLHNQPPASPDLFFCRPLFLWMPLKMWLFPLVCVRPDCGKHRLTAAGLYRTVRKVLDIDGWYDLATEYLECKSCKKKYPAWSEDILGQLDMGHRSQFPALLTYRYSCDNRVLRMMRERTLGNSVTQLYKKLMEQHSEAWTQRVLQYLTACEPFTRSSLVQPPVFAEPPLLPALPKPKWLLAVYARDVLGRLHEVKAKITSVLGCFLKMDSTKKVTKKLAGAASGTAAWCTNVGNEHGQVLVSVLTAAEGHGLDPMAAGLMKRYRDAGEAAPNVMYVDRDCCSQHGQSRVKIMFSEWIELEVRLDIWHFMRRFAAGVTTEAHPLYGIFMARLSTCIFQWDAEDVAALRRAKEGELAAKKTGHVSESAVSARISRRELALHCRRRTRGVEETTRLIGSLIDLFDSADGKDTLGVPLLDHERIQQIWKEQRKHVQCIQDPENFPLYIKTGTLKKGGVELCCYRCARGSTSLESFHLHLNRFIPGELLGMEYLYSQTGKTLTPVLQNPEEEDRLVEKVDDQDLQDEGFDEEITEDITVPVLYEDDPCRDLRNSPSSLPLPQSPASLAEPSTSSGGDGQHLAPAPSVMSQPSEPGSSLSDEAQGAVVGPDGIAGWDKVQNLAGYLVGLREAPYLTDLQVTEAIRLWTALSDFDKQRINYQPRHQPQLTHGRFKAPNRSGVTPGVESVKRCLIGHPGGPAQWPNTSRLVEAICIELCSLHKSPTKKAGVCTPRWSKILSDYHHIRDLVLHCCRLMDETMIQLFELNQKTLIQW
ncbi:Epithelial-stromal interaction 1 [Labeo rohita]|uniref:Epithelial-stromal interaction 1 n=1 Tax=Labeo rohita TaxID=84645 RepID=A0A498MN04_LABRO|nr:Epithelial-stromal interaction 1 [Labeo rohita]